MIHWSKVRVLDGPPISPNPTTLGWVLFCPEGHGWRALRNFSGERHPPVHPHFGPLAPAFLSLFSTHLVSAHRIEVSIHVGCRAWGWSGRLVVGDKRVRKPEFELGGNASIPVADCN